MADRATQQEPELHSETFPTGVQTIVRKLGLLFILILVSILVSIFWTDDAPPSSVPSSEPSLSPLESMRKSDARLPLGFGE